MTDIRHRIWRFLAGASALFLLLPRITLGEFGVCPPHSATFGPDDSLEEILTFIEEVDAIPGGGTLVLEPGRYEFASRLPIGEARIDVTGTLCVRSTSPDPNDTLVAADFHVASGGVLTLRFLEVTHVEIEAGGLLYCEHAVFFLINEGAMTCRSCWTTTTLGSSR